jgi:hypothetical protein
MTARAPTPAFLRSSEAQTLNLHVPAAEGLCFSHDMLTFRTSWLSATPATLRMHYKPDLNFAREVVH